MKARQYQQDVIDGAVALWRSGLRRIAAVLCTGAGKTVVFSLLAAMSRAAGRPVLVLAHRTELIDQAMDKLRQVDPDARIGRMQGATKQYRAEIVVGSVQTCSTETSLNLLRSRQWGLIIIDECHHISASTYVKVLRELRAFEPDGPLVLGVTATLDRSDGLALGDIFEGVVEPRVGLIDLIRHPDGPYLVPPRGVRVLIDGLNLDKVRRVAGDFNSGQLAQVMSDAMAPTKIVEAWQEHAKGRPTIAFLPNVAFSVEQAQAFKAAGYTAVHLDGTTPTGERDATLRRYRAGNVDVLCNVALFTEGTDLPLTSCVILGAPTSSTGRYQQQVGRGLRMHPGKRDCIILDVTGVTKRHRLATLVNLAGASAPGDIPDDLLMYEEDLVDEPAVEADGSEPAPPVEYADGPLAHELVDLFNQAHAAWLRTPGGTWFIPAGPGYLYLRPDAHDERYALCWHDGARHGVVREGMEIGYAMAAGDEYIAARPVLQAHRTAEWRALPQGRSGRTRGEVADARAMTRATHILDNPASFPARIMP